MKHMRNMLIRLVLLICSVTMTGWSQASPDPATVSNKHIMWTRFHQPVPPPQGGARSAATIIGNGIDYHGGPVMLGTVNVYFIWYGDWSSAAALGGMTVLENLVSHFSGSTYYNINTTYYDGALTYISNSVNFAGAIFDNYSQGASLNDGAVHAVVARSISSGQLPNDPNGAYFVLTSGDVNETSGFCSVYCGWHNHDSSSGTDIKIGFVGDPASCLAACAEQSVSPNGDAGIDAMASTIAHEFSELVTDPDINAWYANNGDEMADKCAWTFGNVFTANGEGAKANVTLGGLNYLLQQLWVNESGGFCAPSYGTPAPAVTLTKVAPNSGPQGAAVPVVLTGTGFTSGSRVNVSPAGITVSNVSVISNTQITATFTVAPNATLTGYSVTVTGSSQNSSAQTFTVTSPTPTLTSISPSSGAPGANVPVTLTGTNFVSPATILISGSGVTSSAATVQSAAQITATIQIAGGATRTGYSVTVKTVNGASNPVTFTVAQPTPTLTSISPSSASLNTSTPVTLTGTNFVSPATLNIAGSGVTASGVTVTSSTQINATFNVAANASTGTHNISVSMSNGTTSAVGFTVNASSGGGSLPLSSISPSSGKTGTSVKVTLTGKNLTGLSAIPIQVTGSGITISSVTPVGTSGTTLTAVFTIAANATKSTRFVSVKNFAGNATNTVPFTVD